MNKVRCHKNKPRKFLLYLLLFFAFNLAACNSPELSPFDYQIKVQEAGTGIVISGANVTIEGSGLPKDSITDSTGLAVIRIDAESVNRPGKIIVSANDYTTYSQNIDLIESNLPDTVQLEPQNSLAITPTSPSSTETPTLEATPLLSPSPETLLPETSTPIPPAPNNVLSIDNVANMKLLQTLGQGRILRIALSPNSESNLLAIATPLGVYLYNTVTRQQVTFLATEGSVTEIAFSPDGSKLAVALSPIDDNLIITLWEVESGQKFGQLEQSSCSCNTQSLVFSPNGLRLVDSTWQKIRLWRVDDGQLLDEETVDGAWVNEVAFSALGNSLASVQSDGTVKVWQVLDDSLEIQTTLVHSPTVDLKNVAFSPDDQFIASAGWDNNIINIWSLTENSTPVQKLEHEADVLNLLFYPDNNWLISAAEDSDLYLWNYVTGEKVNQRDGAHAGYAYGLSINTAILPLIATSSVWNYQVKLWQIQDDEFQLLNSTIEGTYSPPIYSVVFTDNTDSLLAGTWSTIAWQWQLLAIDEPERAILELGGILVVISPDNKWLAAGTEHTVSIWHNNDGLWEKSDFSLEGHDDDINQLIFSPDSQLLASASDDGTARLWSLQGDTWMEKYNLDHDGNPVEGVAFSNDSLTLVSGDSSGQIRLWSMTAGVPRESYIGAEDAIWSVAYSPDGSLLAFGTESGTIYLWQMEAGGRKSTLDPLSGHEGIVRSLAFTPDSRLLASGSDDSTVRIWVADTENDWGLKNTFNDARDAVLALAFSLDGSLLAAGARDGIVRVYGVNEP